jgi:hypothetical protein
VVPTDNKIVPTEISLMASRKEALKVSATPGKTADAEVAARVDRAPQKPPRSRGEYGFSVPEAGAMVGLSLNSSYEAAKRGDIPTLKMGGVRIVPRLIWLRMLGVAPAGKTAA